MNGKAKAAPKAKVVTDSQIQEAYNRARNTKEAAKLLGVPRRTFARRLREAQQKAWEDFRKLESLEEFLDRSIELEDVPYEKVLHESLK